MSVTWQITTDLPIIFIGEKNYTLPFPVKVNKIYKYIKMYRQFYKVYSYQSVRDKNSVLEEDDMHVPVGLNCRQKFVS